MLREDFCSAIMTTVGKRTSSSVGASRIPENRSSRSLHSGVAGGSFGRGQNVKLIVMRMVLGRSYKGCPQVVSTMFTLCTKESPCPKEQTKTNQYSPWLLTTAGSNGHPGATTRIFPQELVICPSGC